MNQTWHFYDLATGAFSGRSMNCDGDAVEVNTPDGQGVVAGDIRWDSQRVDLETGLVVDFQPPAPSDDHEWEPVRRRWQLTDKAQQAIAADQQARVAIEAAEQMSLRSVRELLLNPDNTEARAKLQAVEDAIAAQRPQITKKGDAGGLQ